MNPGFVYLCGYDDVVKIGRSDDPVARVKQHNTSNPKTVELFGMIYSSDMDALEKKLHSHFKASRLPDKLEWFVRTDADCNAGCRCDPGNARDGTCT